MNQILNGPPIPHPSLFKDYDIKAPAEPTVVNKDDVAAANAEAVDKHHKLVVKIVKDKLASDILALDALTPDEALDSIGFIIIKGVGEGLLYNRDKIVKMEAEIERLNRMVNLL